MKLIVIKNSSAPLKDLAKELKRNQLGAPPTKSQNIALLYLTEDFLGQVELIGKIKSEWPYLEVIFSGQLQSMREVLALFRAGIADYLIEPTSPEELDQSIQRVKTKNCGGRFILANYDLSKREFQVCKYLVKGLRSKDIAHHLGISPATIKVHKSRIMHKLQVENLVGLIQMFSI